MQKKNKWGEKKGFQLLANGESVGAWGYRDFLEVSPLRGRGPQWKEGANRGVALGLRERKISVGAAMGWKGCRMACLRARLLCEVMGRD